MASEIDPPDETTAREISLERIGPMIAGFEADRVRATRTARLRLILGTAVGAAMSLVFALRLPAVMDGSNLAILVLLPVGIGLYIGQIARRSVLNSWKHSVTDKVTAPLLDVLGDHSFSATASGGFPVSRLRHFGLVPKSSQADLSNRLSGSWHGTNYVMVQARLTESEIEWPSRLLFEGLLFEIEVPEPAPTRIVVGKRQGSPGNGLAGIFGPRVPRAMGRVEVDHAAFRHFFDVRADDPEAAREYLPPAFLDTLIAIGKEEGGADDARTLTAAFDGDRFYMALASGPGFLDLGDASKGPLDYEAAVDTVIADLRIIQRIIDRLHGVEPGAE